MKLYDASCVALLIFFSLSMLVSIGNYFYEEYQSQEDNKEYPENKNQIKKSERSP